MDFEPENPEELIDFLIESPEEENKSLQQWILIQNEEEKQRSGWGGWDGDEFYPAEVVYVIDQGFSRLFGKKIGFFVGVVYMTVTQIVVLTITASLAFLLITDQSFRSNSISLSLIAITVGTFVLMTGSNLSDHFNEDHLNLRGYVHNAITFIGAGLATLTSYIFFRAGQQLSQPYSRIADILSMILNTVAAILLVLSIWVLLKLLWRLSQLILWNRDEQERKPVYSEILATFVGFLIAGGSPLGVLINIGLVVAVVYTVYHFTNDIIIAVLVPLLLPLPRIAFTLLTTELPDELKEGE